MKAESVGDLPRGLQQAYNLKQVDYRFLQSIQHKALVMHCSQ